MRPVYIAIDLGGGSGRVMAGSLAADGEVELIEVHRFANRQVKCGSHIYWDILALFDEIKRGLAIAVRQGLKIKSIGIDTWGVDFGFIGADGNMLANPVCYRDPYTLGLPEQLVEFGFISPTLHYERVGTQVMNINSLYQLKAMADGRETPYLAADKLLFTPDLLSHMLCGSTDCEYTIASTSEMLDARTREWDDELLESLRLRRSILGEVVMPGTVRGELLPAIAQEIGVDYPIDVVAVASHDTASAVYAIPADQRGSGHAFLSSGTWSLLGVIVDSPITTEEARIEGFTNEGFPGGKICFLQNITGMWILQQLIERWKEQGLSTDYAHLIAQAELSTYEPTFDVDHPSFAASGDMSRRITDYLAANGFELPGNQGDMVRCVLHSLALRYRKGILGLNKFLPTPITDLHIIGGGSKNQLLNRLTAEIAEVTVHAGPAEATAIGNILIQTEI